jgi:tetratricopeptide (TPR) repeat protein
MREFMKMRRFLAAALGLAACLGCQAAPEMPLETLAPPATERLEETVRRQLDEALARVEAAATTDRGAVRGAAWGELGRLYDVYGFSAAAATCYRNAAVLDPGRFEWHYYLARLERAGGSLEAAERALGKAMDLAPEDAAARVELARLRVDQGRLTDGVRETTAVLAGDPDHVAARLVRAQASQELEEWAAAAADYERLLALQPSATRLHQPLALAYRALGDLERAESHLARRGDSFVEADDPWVVALQSLRAGVKRDLDEAEALYARGDFAAAEAAFATAIAQDPEVARAHLGRGSALKELGRLQEALAAYGEALEIQPAYAKAHYNRGTVLALLGDDRAALAAYDEALAIEPDNTEARFNRANALLRSERFAEAEAAYAGLIADNPGNGSAHLGRAASLLGMGDDAGAVAALEESDRVFPTSPTFKNALARVWAASEEPAVRDPAKALAMAQRLVAAAATVTHVETLAMAQAAGGDFEAAVATLEKLIAAASRVDATAAEPFRRRVEAFRRGELPRDPDLG